MHRIIKRAGLTPWQRTFQNMRSTRETELAEHFPMHVVTKWIGNTDSVAVQHYLQVTNDHFTKAADGQFDSDGFDIDGCRNVIVRGCHISSGDDGICFKGAAQAPAENILVENCTVFTSCNALKLGTDSQSGFRNVLARNLSSGAEVLATHCVIVMVAVDAAGKPSAVPKWRPASEDDKALAAYAQKLMELDKNIEQEIARYRDAAHLPATN